MRWLVTNSLKHIQLRKKEIECRRFVRQVRETKMHTTQSLPPRSLCIVIISALPHNRPGKPSSLCGETTPAKHLEPFFVGVAGRDDLAHLLLSVHMRTAVTGMFISLVPLPARYCLQIKPGLIVFWCSPIANNNQNKLNSSKGKITTIFCDRWNLGKTQISASIDGTYCRLQGFLMPRAPSAAAFMLQLTWAVLAETTRLKSMYLLFCPITTSGLRTIYLFSSKYS